MRDREVVNPTYRVVSQLGLDKISARSFRNLSRSLPKPSDLEISIFFIILKTFYSEVLLM